MGAKGLSGDALGTAFRAALLPVAADIGLHLSADTVEKDTKKGDSVNELAQAISLITQNPTKSGDHLKQPFGQNGGLGGFDWDLPLRLPRRPRFGAGARRLLPRPPASVVELRGHHRPTGIRPGLRTVGRLTLRSIWPTP